MAKRVTKGNLWGFIQSRSYASVADIRRLFLIEVDGAAAVPTSEGTCYIGLPQEVADVIGQLWHEGRLALDLNPDVKARVVQGVYPARVSLGRQPVARARPTKPQEASPARGVVPSFEPAAPAAAAAGALTGASAASERQATTGKRRRRRRRRGAIAGVSDE